MLFLKQIITDNSNKDEIIPQKLNVYVLEKFQTDKLLNILNNIRC